MKNNKELDIVFLLDRSGSMQGSEEDTIGGYNSYIKSQLKNNVRITTVLFDDQYEMITNRQDIKEIKKLTNKGYYVRGCTALFDAIGKSISFIERKSNNKVIFVITTDGLENASKEYTKNKIRKMIKKHNNWEFVYIGANIDSYAEGRDLGISDTNIANYKKDKKGTGALFRSVGKFCEMACREDCCEITPEWKEELDDYINDAKEC